MFTIISSSKTTDYKKGLLVAGIATFGVGLSMNVVANADSVDTTQSTVQTTSDTDLTASSTDTQTNYYDTLDSSDTQNSGVVQQSDTSQDNQVQTPSDVGSTNSTSVDGQSQLNSAVQNATNVLGSDNVEKTDTNVITADTQEAGDEQANNDYEQQASQINQTVASYQDAVKALDNIDSSNLDEAIAKVKELFGDDFLTVTVQNKTVTVDSVESDIAKINETYKNEADAINVILDSYQKAVAKISQIDQSGLDSAVANAQEVLGKDNVIQEDTKTGSTDLENLANNIATVTADYQQQVDTINKTVTAYQDALKKLATIDSSSLDDAITKAKDLVGEDNLSVTTESYDLGDISTADVDTFVSKMNELIKEQVDSINSQIEAYNKAYSEYEEALKANPNDTNLTAPEKPTITFKTFKYSYTVPQVKYHYDQLTMQKTPISYTTYDVSVEKPTVQYHDNEVVINSVGSDESATDVNDDSTISNTDSNTSEPNSYYDSLVNSNNDSDGNLTSTSYQSDTQDASQTNSGETSLPQMGDTDQASALVGVAMVAMSLGLALLGKRRRFDI